MSEGVSGAASTEDHFDPFALDHQVPIGDEAIAAAHAEHKSPAFQDALNRARQIASKIKPGTDSSSTTSTSLKRPLGVLEDFEGPSLKRSMDGGASIGGISVDQPTTEMISVPDKMVGLIIGRGGEQITRLQAESGCKIQMAQDSAGMPDRQCTLTGASSAIAQAKDAISRIIANEGNGARAPVTPGSVNMIGSSGPMGGGGGGNLGGGGGFYEQMCPGHKVGLIIGKGGEMIKQLQEQSGAKIVIIQESAEAANEKPLRITGTNEAVEMAKQLVNDILNQSDNRDMGGFASRGRGGPVAAFRGSRGGFIPRGGGAVRGRGGFGGNQWSGVNNEYGAQHTDYVQVPSNKCGLIIGKGGETIKSINQSSGATCEIDKNAAPDARDKNFILRGSVDSVERAKNMILEKLGMGQSYSGGGGYGGNTSGSWGGSAPTGYPGYGESSASVTQSADYSAQWAEYYRSMGMIKEAEAIEAARSTGVPQPSGGNAPASNGNSGNADYSAQWAEYYRSVGKIKEAEQIEQQMKTKNGGGAPSSGPGYPQQHQYAQYYGN